VKIRIFVKWAEYHIFRNLKAHLHTFSVKVYCMVSIALMQLFFMTIAYMFLILVEPSFGCCGP